MITGVHPLAARFHNEVSLVAPDRVSLFTSLLDSVAAYDMTAVNQAAAASEDFWPDDEDSVLAWFRPYVVVDGILQIPVKGVLLHDFPYAFFDWATGYEYIQRAFQRGMEDANVKGIALCIDSPGGMVAGCFDAADKMIAAKAEFGKPVRSYAAESAYSAAYAMAVIGDSITVSRTGGVGSIGVVTMHFDVSAAMEKMGYKVTFIHAGKHKVDGNAYEALPDDVKARIQTRIDEMYSVFVEHVAANRPLDEKAVRATEALCFTASQAVSNGTADSIGALDDALAAFAADLSNPPEGEEEMSDSKGKSAGEQAAETAQENPAPAVDAAQVAADAVAADRARRKAIMGSEEAKDRQTLAAHLADETDMSPEQATGILAAAASEDVAPADAATPFGKQMDSEDQPGVGASAAAAENDDDDAAKAEGVRNLASLVGIKGFAGKREA